MENTINGLRAYLDGAHSVYHAIAGLAAQLRSRGYEQLHEQNRWDPVPGGKYFVTRGGSALVAFRMPHGEPAGFLMTASHADRPAFRIKENGCLTGSYTRLATEKYGGMLMSTWLDRPLSVAGRVLVEGPEGIESRLVDIDRDLLLIPNVAIHLNRKANDGYTWNPAVDTLPLLGGKEAEGTLEALLEEAAGGKLLGHDLYLYVRQNASVWGAGEEYISAQGLDDLACAWGCTQGFLDAEENGSVNVLCVFDSEEVGSRSAQGAASGLLGDVLARICDSCGADLRRLLSQSFMLSADNAQALHPNHPELSDSANAPLVGGGLVLKFNANQSYATDGVSAALLRTVCGKAGVPVQTYYNRADLPGGSTLGSISLAHVAVPTADIGLPQLAMHSCYETAGVSDVCDLLRAMQTYYSMTLQCPTDGSYRLN